MSVDMKQIQVQIKSVSVNISMKKKEIKLLAQSLAPEENLITVFQGHIQNKAHRVVLSNKHVYLISKAMFQDSQISVINFNDIDSVEGEPGWLLGKVKLIDRGVKYEISNIPKKAVNLFVQSVKETITQVKHNTESQGTSIEELERLFALKEKGALTEEEYSLRKTQLLQSRTLSQPILQEEEKAVEVTQPPKKKKTSKWTYAVCVILVILFVRAMTPREETTSSSTIQPVASSNATEQVVVDVSGNSAPVNIPKKEFKIKVKATSKSNYIVNVSVETDLPDNALLAIDLWLDDLKDKDYGVSTEYIKVPVKQGKANANINIRELASHLDWFIAGKYSAEASFYPMWDENKNIALQYSISEVIEGQDFIRLKCNGKDMNFLQGLLTRERNRRWVMENVEYGMPWEPEKWKERFGAFEMYPIDAKKGWNPDIIKMAYFKSIDMTLMINILKKQIDTVRDGRADS